MTMSILSAFQLQPRQTVTSPTESQLFFFFFVFLNKKKNKYDFVASDKQILEFVK